MNCAMCDKEMTLRPAHAFCGGSGGQPYEFEVYECHSAQRGFEPGEKYGRRCEETLYYKPVMNKERCGLPMLITGLDHTPSTPSVEEDAHDSE